MLFKLPLDTPANHFPDPELAEIEPNGLLAIGGDLSPARLLAAYQRGIFPWFNPGEPILWWSPNPRMVLFPTEAHISRSMARVLKSGQFSVSLDQAFGQVISECAAPRPYASGTWITEQMIDAYNRLHQLGHAHSLEVWQEGELVGGIYGPAIGCAFFGESMFSRVANASKTALLCLAKILADAGFRLIDCQLPTSHLASLGARPIHRRQYLRLLTAAVQAQPSALDWKQTLRPTC